MLLPTIPRADGDPAGRKAQLEQARAELAYAYDRPAGIAMAREVPRRLGFPAGVIARVAAAEAELVANRAAVRLKEGFHGIYASAPTTLARARDLFALIALPAIAARQDDRAFAWQRLAGACPFVLRRIERLPDSFPVTSAHYARAVPNDSLDAARAEGRLYLADYAVLEGLPRGEWKGRARLFSAPFALFAREKTSPALVPVAIQCAQTPSAAAPIFVPGDGAAWEMARLAVQVADANVEESFHHLGRAHFLVEPFAIATERQLSARHPLHVLLTPHFHGTLAINGAAREKLVVPGGQLDELLAPSLEGSLELVRRGLSSFTLATATFRGDLAARGLDDASALPEHPYRDDGALIDDAIRAFVSEYVAIAYAADDAAVQSDAELHAWLAELRAQDGGRLAGLPEALPTIASVVELVSFVIFSTSARHAALNYTQADFMGFVPNMPTAAFAPPPTASGGDRESAWSAALPPHGLAAAQLEFMWQQSQIRDDRLGDYPAGHFTDPRVAPLLARFRAALDEADARIAERDRARIVPYPYLRPSLLTASIHI